MKKRLTIINKSKFPTKELEGISSMLLAGKSTPDFYLICNDVGRVKGMALTNLDKPTMIIFIENLVQFTETFLHELTHIQQHKEGYANEEEAEDREVIVT